MSSSVVVDASLVVEVILGFPAADAVMRRLEGQYLHAPHLINSEVVHALRRRWLAHEIDDARGIAALQMVETLRIIRHAELALVNRMWELRENFTAYDAAYVALAESLDVPLLTRDARMARSFGHKARIHLVE
jgi:predicted nucleic acid-binding protein